MSRMLQPMVALSPGGNINAYIQAVSAFPVLSQEREQELAQALYYREDLASARELVLAHLRFVVHIARSYSGYGLPLSDLVQEGNVGLMKAVRRFDPDRGVRLVSFAVHWIKAEIHESINKAMSPTDFNSNDLVENKVDLNNSPLLTQEGPKPPTRRKQKPLHQLRQYDDSTVSEKHSEVSSVNERTPKNGGESKPKATTVIYRNRSCSSTHYDNSHSMHNDQSEAKFEASFTKKSSLGEYSDLSSQSAKASKEQSVRNGLYIDLNMIKELRAKKTKPQFVSSIISYCNH